MAMNFLKILHSASGGSSSNGSSSNQQSWSGDPSSASSSSASRAARHKRVYTSAELESIKQIQFLLTKMETLTLNEDRRDAMERLTQAIRDQPELVSNNNRNKQINSQRKENNSTLVLLIIFSILFFSSLLVLCSARG